MAHTKPIGEGLSAQSSRCSLPPVGPPRSAMAHSPHSSSFDATPHVRAPPPVFTTDSPFSSTYSRSLTASEPSIYTPQEEEIDPLSQPAAPSQPVPPSPAAHPFERRPSANLIFNDPFNSGGMIETPKGGKRVSIAVPADHGIRNAARRKLHGLRHEKQYQAPAGTYKA